MSDDMLWRLLSPRAALICATGTLAWLIWAATRYAHRYINNAAGDE